MKSSGRHTTTTYRCRSERAVRRDRSSFETSAASSAEAGSVTTASRPSSPANEPWAGESPAHGHPVHQQSGRRSLVANESNEGCATRVPPASIRRPERSSNPEIPAKSDSWMHPQLSFSSRYCGARYTALSVTSCRLASRSGNTLIRMFAASAGSAATSWCPLLSAIRAVPAGSSCCRSRPGWQRISRPDTRFLGWSLYTGRRASGCRPSAPRCRASRRTRR